MAKPPLGSGARFAKLAAALSSRPGVRDPEAMAAVIGRRKLGAAKFNALAQAGRKRKQA